MIATCPHPWWNDSIWPTWILAFVGIATAVAAICTLRTISRQTAATWKVVRSSEKSNRISAESLKTTRRNSRKELRARVFVVGANRLGVSGPGTFDAEITIRNFGKIPAYECTYAVDLALAPNPKGDIPFPAPRKSGQEPNVVLPPGGEVKVIRSLPSGAFENNQHTLVGNEGWAVYVWGEISYRDGFQKKGRPGRLSTFCMKCCGTDYNRGRFSFCEKGNDAN
jgi:hypothetical protein